MITLSKNQNSTQFGMGIFCVFCATFAPFASGF
jgi:hypothetical protein